MVEVTYATDVRPYFSKDIFILRFFFAPFEPPRGDEKAGGESTGELLRVAISPDEARRLSEALANAVKAYDEKFGAPAEAQAKGGRKPKKG